MTADNLTSHVENFESSLRAKVTTLVETLNSGDLEQAMDLINELYEFRHKMFYQEVGILTRSLHEAIKAFGADMDGPLTNRAVDLNGASERLEYVVEMTEKNAHNTMDRLDRAMVILDKLSETTAPDTADLVTDLRAEMSEILVAQSYQDLSGQLIKKVTTLVTSVEHTLVQLMDMASTVEKMAGAPVILGAKPKANVQAEGPQIVRKDGTTDACDQDEVDELLSSLGF
ncbi:MAG: protein phosphatase CheZ [Pontibacterium sp.]